VAAANPILDYRARMAASLPPFLLPRRFATADTWTKAASDNGVRYLGVFRDQAPDLATILANRRVLILGEPGAGKSTTGQAVVQHVLNNGQPTEIPVLVTLKAYTGDLRALLLRSVPAPVLDAPNTTRIYAFDGVDEVPAGHRDTLRRDLNRLIQTEASCTIVITARQAFYAYHPEVFPEKITEFHLLDFNDQDIDACAKHYGVDTATFLDAVRNVGSEEEIRNPFVLDVMLRRYKSNGSLSPLRSDNVSHIVEQLIHSRPLINAVRQRRTLKMLAITCETIARNDLTDDEARQVLHEAIDLSQAQAEQLLDELSHSILIRTPGHISFQMRSYGEYLAAEELHDKPVDRLKELAFHKNKPVDSWHNTFTYLAEINDKVRQYFTNHHPEWLVNVSPAAFTDDERTILTRRLLADFTQHQTYIVDNRALSWRRLARLLTTDVIKELREQLASPQPHEVANALVLLGLLRQTDIVPQALRLVTAHRNASSLRYAAIIALINANDPAVIDDLIGFLQPDDTYYIQLLDAIGSLCTPADFPRVLPLLESANAGLSAAYYHFRELRTREALTAAITYLTTNPQTLNRHDLDSYLEPVIDLIPHYFDEEIGRALGVLLANLERVQFYDGNLVRRIIRHLAACDQDAVAVRAMVTTFNRTGTRPWWHTGHVISGLITHRAAQWINESAPQYAQELARWLPHGPIRALLDPQPPETIAALEQARQEYIREEQERQQRITTTRAEHQATISTTRDINRILNACMRLEIEFWPTISSEQSDWLAQEVNATLQQFDLATSITWIDQHQWSRPCGLEPLLNLIEHYNLLLANDVPIVLALRSWPDNAITNYYRRNGLSVQAHQQLIMLLQTAENENIVRNVLTFLREAKYDTSPMRDALRNIGLDATRSAQLRIDAIDRLTNDDALQILPGLLNDPEDTVRSHAMHALVTLQHRPTISRALANLTDDEVREADVAVPYNTPLDWIGNITLAEVFDELRRLRRRAVRLNSWRVTTIITATIAKIDKSRAARTIREQINETPPPWQDYFRQEADKLEREARIQAAQQTPFVEVIRKLKGATSMIVVKVWCEGLTDRPILRKLFRELGEEEIARTMGLIGGWPNLRAEREPEHWLDGCRQAIIIMDGDQGRDLSKSQAPLTEQAKDLQRHFADFPLTLHVLGRHGIEHYLPRHAYETVLGRDLAAFFPIPPNKKIIEHFSDPTPFYNKGLNERIAEHTTLADVEGTDLADILRSIKQTAEAARQY